MRRRLGLVVALIVLAALFILPFFLAPRPSGDAESFAGTDSVATSTLEERGVTPWFEPLFEPGSGEVESGLFALQAAVGAGVLGYCLGALRRRSRDTTRED